MTIERFERIVLQLANRVPVRWWRHWNYPLTDPVVMSVRIYQTAPSAEGYRDVAKDLGKLGLEACEADPFLFTVKRTEEPSAG